MRCGSVLRRVTIAIALAALATPVMGQQIQSIQDRGYVAGFGGATFTNVSSPLFGGGIGFNIGPDFQITGEVGHMLDVTPPFTNEDLKLAEQGMVGPGVTLSATTEVPTTYVSAGGRWLLPTSSSVRPYIMGSGGVAFLRPAPSFVFNGQDVTAAVLTEPVTKTAFADRNRPLASIGGGVKVAISRHVIADVAYRYSRIFIREDYLQDIESPTKHSGININRVVVGFGYQF